MARWLRLILIAVLTVALAAGGMIVGTGMPAIAAAAPGVVVTADHGACQTCQASPVVAATSHHCASSCPSLIGIVPDGMTFAAGARILPLPAPGDMATGRGTTPDPIPPRS